MKASLILAVPLTCVLFFCFACERKEKDEEEKPVNVPSRVSVQAGRLIITLDQATQRRVGIEVMELQVEQEHLDVPAYGVVLQVDDLLEANQKYVELRAQVEKAAAALAKSQVEYDRDKRLRTRGIVSEAEFEAEQETYRADLASAKSAETLLGVLQTDIQQKWGGVIADWVFQSSSSLQRLLKLQDVLVQITTTSTTVLQPPPTIRIPIANDRSTEAAFVSSSPRSDPRIQGRGYFYIAPAADNTLLPGMNVSVSIPTPERVRGVILPEKALVWSEGTAWCYIQKDAQHFVKQDVPTDTAVPGGWFVSTGIKPGDRVVISHPQLLLSEESRIQSTGEAD